MLKIVIRLRNVFGTIRGQVVALFFIFGVLMLASGLATIYGTAIQQYDAHTINLAGRQRMLIQQMARLAFEAGAQRNEINFALQTSMTDFAQTLSALRDGGFVPSYLPSEQKIWLEASGNNVIRSQLKELDRLWQTYRFYLEELQNKQHDTPEFVALVQQIQAYSTLLVEQADRIVRLYEEEARKKIGLVRTIQLGFLLSALPLLMAAMYFVQNRLLVPLQVLREAALKVGENELDFEIPIIGTRELRALGQAFDQMRVNLRASRQELLVLNSTLEQRVIQRTRELEALHQISEEITARLDVQELLNSTTEKARILLNGEVASLCLIDEEQRWFKLQSLSGPPEALRTKLVPLDDLLPQTVIHHKQAVACGLKSCYGGCGMLHEAYRKHHLAVSLRVEDRVIGALCVGSRGEQAFSENSPEILTKLAGIAAIALENARLYAQAERVAALEERRRLAAEMHDGLAQTLSYLGLMTDQTVEFLTEGQDEPAIQRLYRTRDTIERATAELRRAIDDLLDDSLPILDFCKQLQQNTRRLADENHLTLIWQSDLPEIVCTPTMMQQINSIVREAFLNIVRHARAHTVKVRLSFQDPCYMLTIEDDGIGFDLSKPQEPGHFGLQIMQARAAHLGGKLDIHAQPGQGTRLSMIWRM